MCPTNSRAYGGNIPGTRVSTPETGLVGTGLAEVSGLEDYRSEMTVLKLCT